MSEGHLNNRDIDAVGVLLADIVKPKSDTNRRRVTEIDGVRPVRSGIKVTLTVHIPTRMKFGASTEVSK